MVVPLWWRLIAWGLLTGDTVYTAPTTGRRVLAGVLMGTAVVAFQFAQHRRRDVRIVLTLLATAAGLGACFASPDGLAEVIVAMAASRGPDAFDGRVLIAFTVVDTLAFGATVGYISRSLAGALAGTAVPLLVQRSLEHRELVRERDRAQSLLVEVEAGREAETQAAALRERGRIAREMHDVLAHSLAGLSVQLQAVRAVAGREGAGEAVLGPLDKAAKLARDGLTEARAAVSALRDPVGLGLDALPALVRRHPGEVTLTTTGTAGEVNAAAGHAIYRGVQEALTNAARYAPGSPVAVGLAWTDGTLTATVDDAGPPLGHTAVPGQGTGLGLAGMAERVQQAGGTVQAGPRAGGGWRVAITVAAEQP